MAFQEKRTARLNDVMKIYHVVRARRHAEYPGGRVGIDVGFCLLRYILILLLLAVQCSIAGVLFSVRESSQAFTSCFYTARCSGAGRDALCCTRQSTTTLCATRVAEYRAHECTPRMQSTDAGWVSFPLPEGTRPTLAEVRVGV